MRRLLLLRHAKSSWDDPRIADIDRPLAPRGVKAAAFMGRYIAEEGLMPDRIVVSVAQRTRATLAGLLPAFGAEMDIHLTGTIYEAGPEAVIKAIRERGGEAARLLVIGHNPGLEEAAARLARNEPSPDLEAMRTRFPTAALAVIDFEIAGWAELAAGAGRLSRFVRPRALMEEGEPAGA